MYTHRCNIYINSLLVTLTGHIIPDLSIALLFGIRVLTKAGCTVEFDNHRETLRYNNHVILMDNKDKTTNLWTLPLRSSMTTLHSPAMIMMAAPVCANAHAHLPTQIAFFTHMVRTNANSIHFAHQSFCNPRISTLLMAFQCRYLKGCPNLTTKGITKYLNPSPAFSKGHMRCPHKGICSTICVHQAGANMATIANFFWMPILIQLNTLNYSLVWCVRGWAKILCR